MDNTMMKLVTYAMLGSIARKIRTLSEIDKNTRKVLYPDHSKPRPSRDEIKSDARRNFKRTMRLLSKGIK